MSDDVKKTVCPKCGAEDECFCGRVVDDFLLHDEYILWCSACGKQETKRQPAGRRIADRDYPQRTVCPFCGRPPSEHRQGLSSKEVNRLIRPREGEDGSLHIPEDLHKRPAAGIAPPPRARRRTVKTAKTVKPVTSRAIATILIYLAPLYYALALGASVFIARTSEGTSPSTALHEGLAMAGVIFVAMIFALALIAYDFRRRFKADLRQKE